MTARVTIVSLLIGAVLLGASWGPTAAAPQTTVPAAVPDAYTCPATGTPLAECQALVAIYNGTGGPAWTTRTGWLNAAYAPCTWYGVSCDANNSVIGLDLSVNNLTGPLPPDVGSLTKLNSLMLGNNALSGAIPTALGSLANLQYLDLSYNSFSGSIPTQLGSLTGLLTLNLGFNQLTGSIPTQLGSLTNLLLLVLGSNQLTGAIPTQLGSLTALQQLDLGNNQLTGTVPSQLGSLAALGQLYLAKDAQVNRGLPQSLKTTPLWEFWFDTTGLCEPPDTAYQTWLSSITSLMRTNVKCAPVASTVAISNPVNTGDIVLNWTDQSPNTGYEVHRDATNPYFTAGAANLLGSTLPEPAQTATDTGAFSAASNYYYVVQSKYQDSANGQAPWVNDLSADSNRTAKFSFALVPGK